MTETINEPVMFEMHQEHSDFPAPHWIFSPVFLILNTTVVVSFSLTPRSIVPILFHRKSEFLPAHLEMILQSSH
jgi:hypothetical protein